MECSDRDRHFQCYRSRPTYRLTSTRSGLSNSSSKSFHTFSLDPKWILRTGTSRTSKTNGLTSTTRACHIVTINDDLDAGYGTQRRWNSTSQLSNIVQIHRCEIHQISQCRWNEAGQLITTEPHGPWRVGSGRVYINTNWRNTSPKTNLSWQRASPAVVAESPPYCGGGPHQWRQRSSPTHTNVSTTTLLNVDLLWIAAWVNMYVIHFEF